MKKTKGHADFQWKGQKPCSVGQHGGLASQCCVPTALHHLPAFLLPLPLWVHQHMRLSQQRREKLNAAVVGFLNPKVNAWPHPMWDSWHIHTAQTLSMGQVTSFLPSQELAATVNSPLQAQAWEKSRMPSEDFPPSKALLISGFQRSPAVVWIPVTVALAPLGCISQPSGDSWGEAGILQEDRHSQRVPRHTH